MVVFEQYSGMLLLNLAGASWGGDILPARGYSSGLMQVISGGKIAAVFILRRFIWPATEWCSA